MFGVHRVAGIPPRESLGLRVSEANTRDTSSPKGGRSQHISPDPHANIPNRNVLLGRDVGPQISARWFLDFVFGEGRFKDREELLANTNATATESSVFQPASAVVLSGAVGIAPCFTCCIWGVTVVEGVLGS